MRSRCPVLGREVEGRAVRLDRHPAVPPQRVDEERARRGLDSRPPLRLGEPRSEDDASEVGLAHRAHPPPRVTEGLPEPGRQAPAQPSGLLLERRYRADPALEDVGDHMVDVGPTRGGDAGVDGSAGRRGDPHPGVEVHSGDRTTTLVHDDEPPRPQVVTVASGDLDETALGGQFVCATDTRGPSGRGDLLHSTSQSQGSAAVGERRAGARVVQRCAPALATRQGTRVADEDSRQGLLPPPGRHCGAESVGADTPRRQHGTRGDLFAVERDGWQMHRRRVPVAADLPPSSSTAEGERRGFLRSRTPFRRCGRPTSGAVRPRPRRGPTVRARVAAP
ncbi:hypothetical protein SAMN05660991_03381 [Trujillonella endophytica]|uniref:Uncharacterized protein n=1 Tax=Trujillonella endophytica TaxID=673521 RepID=A0A1H8VAH1_9ACTN|nr:hypothetical protein SAMN05660991_03381 [Trujillella endophytica]